MTHRNHIEKSKSTSFEQGQQAPAGVSLLLWASELAALQQMLTFLEERYQADEETPVPIREKAFAHLTALRQLLPSLPSTEMLLCCHPGKVKNLVEALTIQIRDARLPASVRWSGHSGLLHQGVLLLTWRGHIPDPFLHHLRLDHEMMDLLILEELALFSSEQGTKSEDANWNASGPPPPETDGT